MDIRYVTEINGIELDNYISWALIIFAITLTASPAMSVPCGFTRSGLPVGLQMVGPRGKDAALLSAAALFEQETGLAARLPMDPLG